jgi:hypothetical protein
MLDTYNQLLTQFAQHVGLDAEELLKTQEIVIESLAIGLAFEGDEAFGDLVYFTQLGAPAESRVAEVYKTLLQANNLWAGTGGSTLGLQPDTDNVILAGRMDVAGVTPQGLSLVLDAFTDTALFWKKFVADELPASSEPPPDGLMLKA